MSLAALTGEEVNTFRLEVARRMRTEQWNDSIPWSSEAAKKVIMVRSYLIYATNRYGPQSAIVARRPYFKDHALV